MREKFLKKSPPKAIKIINFYNDAKFEPHGDPDVCYLLFSVEADGDDEEDDYLAQISFEVSDDTGYPYISVKKERLTKGEYQD